MSILVRKTIFHCIRSTTTSFSSFLSKINIKYKSFAVYISELQVKGYTIPADISKQISTNNAVIVWEFSYNPIFTRTFQCIPLSVKLFEVAFLGVRIKHPLFSLSRIRYKDEYPTYKNEEEKFPMKFFFNIAKRAEMFLYFGLEMEASSRNRFDFRLCAYSIHK